MLNIENLSVSYGETLILRDLNMEVHGGEMVCLMGSNGVGKAISRIVQRLKRR